MVEFKADKNYADLKLDDFRNVLFQRIKEGDIVRQKHMKQLIQLDDKAYKLSPFTKEDRERLGDSVGKIFNDNKSKVLEMS